MDKQQFLKIIQNQGSLKKPDVDQIQKLEEKYPYSQIIRVLAAIGSKKYQQSEASKKLTIAAVYATDRKHLKEILVKATGSNSPAKTSPPPKKQSGHPKIPVKNTPSRIQKKPNVDTSHPPMRSPPAVKSSIPRFLSERDAENLRIEVMKNLEDLLEIKKHFFKDNAAIEKISSKKISTQKVSETSGKKTKKVASTKKTKAATPVTKKTVPVQKAAKNSNKEQKELIDKFIEKEPTIKKKNADEIVRKNDDLAKKSVAFGDHLISENLAKMLTKQGKVSKAIDIYKKLIWKFPQKKAYFASQIESLKGK